MVLSCVFFHGHAAINTVYLCKSPGRSMRHQNDVVLANQKEKRQREGGRKRLFNGV